MTSYELRLRLAFNCRCNNKSWSCHSSYAIHNKQKQTSNELNTILQNKIYYSHIMFVNETKKKNKMVSTLQKELPQLLPK